MRLDRIITLGILGPIRKIFGFQAAPCARLPILMYHSISADPEPAFAPYYKICTSPERFAEHMQWLAAAGYRGVTLREGLAWLNATGPATEPLDPRPERLVAITFDDGFRDFHTAAFPALQRHGFSATMYLPSAFIGDERRSFKTRECLTWTEVRELAAAGMEFGSHTVNHPILYTQPWPDIERELRESRLAIEQHLSAPCHSFAYPFAFPQEDSDFTGRLYSLLRDCGYTNCATTKIGLIQSGDDHFGLTRLPANSEDDRRLFMAKLSGAYDWLATPQFVMRRIRSWLEKKTSRTVDPRP